MLQGETKSTVAVPYDSGEYVVADVLRQEREKTAVGDG